MRPIRASESFLEFPTALLCPFPGASAGHTTHPGRERGRAASQRPKRGIASPNMSLSAYFAAWKPGMPVTPGPGGVEDEHR